MKKVAGRLGEIQRCLQELSHLPNGTKLKHSHWWSFTGQKADFKGWISNTDVRGGTKVKEMVSVSIIIQTGFDKPIWQAI